MLDFPAIQARVTALVERDGDRDADLVELRKMWDMRWDEKPAQTWIKDTLSPDPHNSITSMVNLLISADPGIVVPHDTQDDAAKDAAEKQQRALRLMIERASKLRLRPVLHDVVLSACRDGGIAVKLIKTLEVVEALDAQAKERAKAAGGKSKLDKDERLAHSRLRDRYDTLAKTVPFLIEVLEWGCVHYDSGAAGLECVAEVNAEYQVGRIRELYGEGPGIPEGAQDTDEVEFRQYWDHEQVCVWIDGQPEPVYQMEHQKAYLPYVIQPLAEPPLLPVVRGKIWNRQNLVLTMISSLTFAMSNPRYVVTTQSGESDVQIDGPVGSQISLRTGETITPLVTQAVSREMMDLLGITSSLMEASTVSKMVQGISEAKGMAYSSVNAVMLAGKQKIEPIKQSCDWALSAMCELMLRWVKDSKRSVTLWTRGQDAELKPADIDQAHIEVECKLQPDYPQDRLQLINFITIALRARTMSRESGMALLGLDPNDENDRILTELFEDQFVQAFLKQAEQNAQALIPPQEPLPEPPPQALLGPGAAPIEQQPMEEQQIPGLPPTMGQGVPPPEQVMQLQQAAQAAGGQ